MAGEGVCVVVREACVADVAGWLVTAPAANAWVKERAHVYQSSGTHTAPALLNGSFGGSFGWPHDLPTHMRVL